MSAFYKTKIERAMLSQEVRMFVAPAAFWRRVQIVLPPEPRFFIGVDVDVTSEGADTKADPPGGWGADRVYKGPPMNGDQQIELRLAPGQWLVGATESGAHPIAVILEWASGPSEAG